eukprot:TRINITY_DN9373_c0_g1_i1.p1 TRINITY_DN9373_c0_g1~~TRINITY_DN9373_c0_g1_i1.p1  ORF type:complete len:113 (-),score=20.52 TRINITY_DN9373_c0_g1_i1:470-808(-)
MKQDEWLKEYDACLQLASEISADIKDHHSHIRANSNNGTSSVKLSAIIRRKLVQLTKDLASLHDNLLDVSNITEREKNRRADMVLNLTTRKNQLSELLNQNPMESMSPGQRY